MDIQDEDAPPKLTEFPPDRYERALAFEEAICRCVGGTNMLTDDVYGTLRRELVSDAALGLALPLFLRDCRTVSQLLDRFRIWPTWQERRRQVQQSFAGLLNQLERTQAPAEKLISAALFSFSAGGVRSVWEKALSRSDRDPEGAVTAARTLLEEVCKHILDGGSKAGAAAYTDRDDLPKLYRLASERLNLAPSQHSEEAFKRILGGCTSVVEGLGSLRNKVGDAHGKGKRAVQVRPRHAHLAVNLAGAMALYLVETAETRKLSGPAA